MNNGATLILFAAAIATLSSACDSDSEKPNPSFTTSGGRAGGGEKSGGAAGRNSTGSTSDASNGGAGGDSNGGSAGAASSGAGDFGNGGIGGEAGGSAGTAGSSGAATEQPPYDCVLHPRTHLEIINACTDAVRIEKHPDVPPVEP